VLLLAVPGAVRAARRGRDADWLLLGWIVTTVVGMYVPLSLQRRLSLGLGVPLGLLAGVGLWQILRARVALRGASRLGGLLRGLAVALCALTPVFLVLMALLAAQGGSPWFYLDDGEWAALAWLRDRRQPGAVVLCAPQTGSFVPAWAGQPVVYGHPFETVDAERRRTQVEAFWAGEMGTAEREAFLRENRVTYVFAGPRELGGGTWALDLGERVFQAGGVSLYEITLD
jgi:hypothetical protein